jgi:hypothetical protein
MQIDESLAVALELVTVQRDFTQSICVVIIVDSIDVVEKGVDTCQPVDQIVHVFDWRHVKYVPFEYVEYKALAVLQQTSMVQ